MDLYQAGYTRRGKQGEGSGWSLVSESDGMSTYAKDGFAGFAGNLAELVQSLDMPDEAIGVFRDDRFLYYLHINYKAEAEDMDIRGVSFTHGYCFNITDYYVLCEEPEKLLGVTEDTFFKNYDSNEKSYPVKEEFSYQPMNFSQLKEKYNLSAEAYRRLLIGATCAIEGYTDSLCIKVNCEKEAYTQVCKEMMYLIMQGLPYHLRIKVTFFSYRGGKTNIYFSDKIEGNNYFDLDTKDSECNKSRLEKYRFTLLYNVEDDSQRQMIFKLIAEFMEKSFDVPLKEMDCEHIEHGFLAKIKNIVSKDPEKDLVINKLTSFMDMPLKETEEVDEYIAILLGVINERGLIIENKKLLNRVVNQAQHSANASLQNAYLEFYARQILAGDKTDSYELLWNLYQNDNVQYQIITKVIKRMNEEFYLDYYRNVFLPKRLKDMKSIISYLQECNAMDVLEKRFGELLDSITKKELDEAKNFIEQFEVHEKAKKIADSLNVFDYAQNYLELTDLLIWKKFNLEEFNPEDIDLYKACSLNKLLLRREPGRVNTVIKIVNGLVDILENKSDGSYQKNIYSLIFEDEIVEDSETKKILLRTIRKYDLPKARYVSEKNFDLVITCYYDIAKGRFDIPGLIEWLYRKEGKDIFETQCLKRLIRNSEIFDDWRLKSRFEKELRSVIEEKDEKDIDKQIFYGIKKFYSCLTNETIIEETHEESNEQNMVFSIHKIVVGYLALFAIGFFLLCLKQYAKVTTLPVVGIGALVSVMVILLFGFKIYNSDGFESYFVNAGFTTSQKLLIGIGVGVILVSSTILMVLLLWKLPILQQKPAYLKTLIIVIIMAVYILAAIAGAVCNSIEEE